MPTDPADLDDPVAPDSVALVGVEPAKPELLATRALAAAIPPLVTAPLNVERPPRASGGPAAILVGLNDILRKPGLRRGLRLVRAANQASGFVCPGCAWPTPDRRRLFEVCELGVRVIADEATLREAGRRLFETYTIPELAQRSDHWLASQGRLTEPMIRRADSNSYEPIGWKAAFEQIGRALAGLTDPDRAAFYVSARVANEPAFVVQLLARAIGTNNLASSSQLGDEASRIAFAEVLGDPRATLEGGLADFERAEAIFVFGSNPGSSHPRMLASLRAAKARGAKIVAINPLREASLLAHRSARNPADWVGGGATIADLLLPVRVAGDLALIVGLSKAVIEAGAVDREFVERRTRGFAEFEAGLAGWTWAEVCERSGLDEPSIRAAAAIYASSNATIVCWGSGLTQQLDGVGTLEQLLGLLLLRGNLGKPGAGPLALLGSNNTRGNWTMGVLPTLTPAARERLADATKLAIPDRPGLDVVGALAAMRRDEIDVFVNLGGNLLSTGPDTEQVADALRRCKLSVHLATKLDRGHLITGETSLLLPTLTRGEIDRGGPISVEDLIGVVRTSVGRVPPIRPTLRSEVEILTRIGRIAAPEAGIDWTALGRDHARVRELIRASVAGCEGFTDELQRTRSFRSHVPLTSAEPKFVRAPAPAQTLTPAADGTEFVLTTIRSHDQHDSTIYSHGDRERGITGYRRIVLINLADLRRLGIEPFDQVDLSSTFDGRTRTARRWVAVPHPLPVGTLAAYWPEANVLVPTGAVDPRSGTPAFKSVLVTIEYEKQVSPTRLDRFFE